MAITFKGNQIKCGDHHEYLAVQGGEVVTVRTHFFGIKGNSEIVSKPGFWGIESVCWLADSDWTANQAGFNKLQTYLTELRDLRGENGTLKHTMADGTDAGTWLEATFEGFTPAPFEGFASPSPIKDVVGMANSANGWIMKGVLRWTLVSDTRIAGSS